MKEWTTLLDDLTAYLRWEQECGVRTEEMDPATLRDLSTPAKAAPHKPVAPSAPASAPVTPRATPSPAKPPAMAFTLPVNQEPVAERPAETAENRQANLSILTTKIAVCRLCPLCEKRTQTVPGEGKTLAPDILFIGEAASADDDRQGQPFLGASGELLTRMITAMGYSREEVFITTICKCHPPESRHPTLAEMQACLPYLCAQISAIRPRVLVALGATTVKGLLDASTGVSRLRGVWTTFQGIPMMPTYHPSHLLRYPDTKKDAWEDLKKVLHRLGRPVPAKK
jgi:uracil-DNA glycosylase family 4